MLLTITTTHNPGSDLGYLLHKHPDRLQTFNLNFGKAHIFYPEVSEERCTAALLIDVDPIGLVRKDRGKSGGSFALRQYVNDRPYAASSFLSVAISQLFGTAMNGTSKDRPELAATPIPLEAHLPVVPCRGGEALLRQLFEPLGYAVDAEQLPLDEKFTEWGESRYFRVTLRNTIKLSDLLGHIYVLIPVLDNNKHYWVAEDEVEKLLRQGEGWLGEHPMRELIANRYLRHRRSLTKSLMEQLSDEVPDPDEADDKHNAEEEAAEKKIGLHQLRLETVCALLRDLGAKSVLDLGCGEGKLLSLLAKEQTFEQITGLDLSLHGLEVAERKLSRLPDRLRKRISLIQGSLTYRDRRIEGYDAAAVVEVIEHLEPERLAAFERALFGYARPGHVIITTPNSDYNVMWPSLPAGKFRHYDHRFEWSREEFRSWSERIAEEYGYEVAVHPLGPEEEGIGGPSQMGVFKRCR
ncbi:MAG: 3' terminal RNA ribose 2'-O-methyltransferase Hen1 [Candidatus Kapaibacterium sp.]